MKEINSMKLPTNSQSKFQIQNKLCQVSILKPNSKNSTRNLLKINLKKYNIRIIKNNIFYDNNQLSKRSGGSIDLPNVEFQANCFNNLISKDYDESVNFAKSFIGRPRLSIQSKELFDIQEENIENIEKRSKSVAKNIKINLKPNIPHSINLPKYHTNNNNRQKSKKEIKKIKIRSKSRKFIGQITLQDYIRQGKIGTFNNISKNPEINSKSLNWQKTPQNIVKRSRSRVVFMKNPKLSVSQNSDYFANKQKSRNFNNVSRLNTTNSIFSTNSNKNSEISKTQFVLDWAKTRYFARIKNNEILNANYESLIYDEKSLTIILELLMKNYADLTELKCRNFYENLMKTMQFMGSDILGNPHFGKEFVKIPIIRQNLLKMVEKCMELYKIKQQILPIYLLILEKNVFYYFL